MLIVLMLFAAFTYFALCVNRKSGTLDLLERPRPIGRSPLSHWRDVRWTGFRDRHASTLTAMTPISAAVRRCVDNIRLWRVNAEDSADMFAVPV